jgi:hypothetical protein
MYVMEAREEVEGTAPQDKGRLQQLLDANSALEERCLEVRVAGPPCCRPRAAAWQKQSQVGGSVVDHE